MRKPTDFCLLCKANLATKTNSHILPKFLSTNFLGSKGNQRKGYDLNSDKILNKKPKVIQDSPKENYILCEECEAYFSVLEGIACDTFINWQTKVSNGEFTLNKKIEDIDIVECNNSDKRTIHLFNYSIFWRASISSLTFFSSIKFVEEFEDELRIILMQYKQMRKEDYIRALNEIPTFKIFPTTIITSKSFINETVNVLFVPRTYDPYCIIVDRYKLMLFKTVDDITPEFVKSLSNIKIDDCRIIIFSEKLWYNLILKQPYELYVEAVLDRKI